MMFIPWYVLILYFIIEIDSFKTSQRESHYILENTANNKCRCLGYDPSAKTVAVVSTLGDLGDKMVHYALADMLRKVYDVDVFIVKSIHEHLKIYFDFSEGDQIPVAEENLCGFEMFWKTYTTENKLKLAKAVIEETIKRNNQDVNGDKSLFKKSNTNRDLNSIHHSSEIYKIQYPPSDHSRSFSSFPWQQFNQSASELLKSQEKYGKAYLFYPGFDFNIFDGDINEDHPMDNVPSLMKNILKLFTFKDTYLKTASAMLQNIKIKFIKKKKKKKSKPILYVGIHNRRTDHIQLQQEFGFVPLDAGYFLESMDLYRTWFSNNNVIFLYVSDDLQWAEEKLLPRVKTKDIYIAGSLQYPEYRGNKTLSTGLDLALLSLCNHTITSYGSYSFWASFLAGEGRGKRIIPQFFTKYRLPSHRSHQLSKHPFKSKLPRFFHGVKNLGR